MKKQIIAASFITLDDIKEIIIYFIFFGILWGYLFSQYALPNITPDSLGYIRGAMHPGIITMRPIGYGIFLYLVSLIPDFYHFIFLIQYIIYAISSLVFLFTIKYFFPAKSRVLYYIFSIFLLYQPVSLFLSTFVMSDSLFISLTLIWISSGIWILGNQKLGAIVLHLLFLIFMLNVRYISIFFVPVSIFFLFFASRKLYLRVALSLLPVLIFVSFSSITKQRVYGATGVQVFSGFSG
ncbi:MAG: hypothetical protein EOL88_14720 [Bacteroidia bacterium]|nr:hypothetical protein [Bacteroidia bacterium]